MIIDTTEFSKLIWETIQQELDPEKRTILKGMTYQDPEFEQGFIQGLAWASILAVAGKMPEPKAEPEDASQRVIAALEGEGFYDFNSEEEKSYNESIDRLYKPLGINIEELKPEDC